jgi:two-component system, chemotaxis family, protein-glutamate methylesterase/glutaminase
MTLFSSLALNAGRRTIGVVLSGLLKDGTLGLKAIKQAGGVALVQIPQEAEYPGMTVATSLTFLTLVMTFMG